MLKKLSGLFFALFLMSSLHAQVIVDEININELEDVKYCELVGTERLLNNKIIVQIDHGQPRKFFRQQTISNKNGNRKNFNSMIDALNFMEKNGWSYINSYTVTSDGTSIYHWLLKRNEE